MDRWQFAAAAAVAGAVVVGPVLSHALVWWLGWRCAVPSLLGWQPSWAETRPPRSWRPDPGATLARRLPALRWWGVAGPRRAYGTPLGPCILGVEVATGVGFGVVAARLGWSIEVLPVLVLVAGLVAASAVDLVCGRIPTLFVYVTAAGALLAMGVAVLVEHDAGSLVGAAVGGVTCFGLLELQYRLAHWLASGRFGAGDVRLGSVIGLVLGWLGWIAWPPEDPYPAFGSVSAGLTALLVGSLAASVIGLALRVIRGRGQVYPFGPWLSLGGLVAVLLVA